MNYVNPGKRITGIVLMAVMLFTGISQLAAQVILSGVLQENTTLSSINNPYVVIQDVVVPHGITLTIEPGTHIRFSSDTRLVVKGTLVAIGQADDSIYFYHVSNPNPAIWKGIVFDSTETILDENDNYVSGTILSYASIYHSTYAVTLSGNSNILMEHSLIRNSDFGMYFNNSRGCLIRNCRITGSSLGIFFPAGFSASANRFRHNVIENNYLIGVVINNCNSKVRYNTFTENRIQENYIGLYVGNEGEKDSGHNIFIGNEIFSNVFEGLRIYQDSTWFEGNLVFNNAIGLNLRHAEHSVIQGNYFKDNDDWALILSDSALNNQIVQNNISENGGGIWIPGGNENGSAGNYFTHNTLYQNAGRSFILESVPQAEIQFNNIVSNGDTNSFVNRSVILVHAENNWWGSMRESLIDSIIYDKNDDPFKGLVQYQNYLDHPDTLCPILPPRNVVKRQAGDDVILSWDTVDAEDLGGYFVHYGNYDGVRFSNVLEAGIHDSYIIPNHSVFDTIAVSSHDLQADGLKDQIEGHESQYVMALLSPYAGPDTTVCINSALYLDKATAFNYEFIDWSTSGDGAFNGVHVLKTRYQPGPNDYLSGKVELTLTVSGIGFSLTDKVLVHFGQPPYAYAGNDSTIFADTSYYTISAQTESDKGFYWETSGDGTFEDPHVLHTLYFPGTNDILNSSFTLTLHALSFCGEITDDLEIELVKGSTIHGRVLARTVPATGSALDLFKYSSGIYDPGKGTAFSPDGYFNLGKLVTGNYYLYAFPDRSLFPGYAPTYYPNKVHWKDAYIIPVNDNTYDLDIQLAELSAILPAGAAAIRGNCVSLGGGSSPCENTVVLLYDKTGTYLLGWAEVEEDGTFEFSSLPFGQYLVIGERAGYERTFSDVMVLSPEQPEINNAELRIEPFKISIWFPDQPNDGEDKVQLYPLPFEESVTFAGLPEPGKYDIVFTAADGRNYKYYIMSEAGEPATLGLSGLPTGFYLLRIFSGHELIQANKIVKK